MYFYCSKTIHFEAKRPGRWSGYGNRGGAKSVYLSTKAAPSHRVVKMEVEVLEVELEVVEVDMNRLNKPKTRM